MGLIEQEWIETLSTLDFDDVIYESFIEVGNRLAKELREIDVSVDGTFSFDNICIHPRNIHHIIPGKDS